MLEAMQETSGKSPSEPTDRHDLHEGDDNVTPDSGAIALPSHVAGSGTLDRLVETARDFARQAASENTLKAYARDWAQFTRWCRMRGADPLPPLSRTDRPLHRRSGSAPRTNGRQDLFAVGVPPPVRRLH